MDSDSDSDETATLVRPDDRSPPSYGSPTPSGSRADSPERGPSQGKKGKGRWFSNPRGGRAEYKALDVEDGGER